MNTRLREHISTSKRDPNKGSRLLNHAINKYGSENITIEQIAIVSETLKDITETFCISYFNTLTPNGYNLQTGGTNTTHSDETKLLRSKSLKELFINNPEKRIVWSNAKLGVSQGIKNNRKFDEDKKLPKYLVKRRGQYENGYVIDSHPKCNYKRFTSRKFTIEENYNNAIEYLKILNENI